MIRSRARLSRLVAALAVIAVSGCVSVSPPRFLQVPSDREWKPTLDRATALASGGQVERADSVLAQFATTYPTAPQAIEASYWRALLNLRSPAAADGVSRAIPLLQTYVAAGPSTEHWAEADALLHAASRVDTSAGVSPAFSIARCIATIAPIPCGS